VHPWLCWTGALWHRMGYLDLSSQLAPHLQLPGLVPRAPARLCKPQHRALAVHAVLPVPCSLAQQPARKHQSAAQAKTAIRHPACSSAKESPAVGPTQRGCKTSVGPAALASQNAAAKRMNTACSRGKHMGAVDKGLTHMLASYTGGAQDQAVGAYSGSSCSWPCYQSYSLAQPPPLRLCRPPTSAAMSPPHSPPAPCAPQWEGRAM
jgi:hypothetical protein